MRRYYFIGDDIDRLAEAERELEDSGFGTEQVHVLSLNDYDVERRHLHEVQSLLRQDVIHASERGALVGLALSIVALVAAALAELPSHVGWMPFVFLAIVLFGFFTWEGGLYGIQVPNSRFRRFERALRDGRHILFVDVTDDAEERRLEEVRSRYPELEAAGTGSSTPHWLIAFQRGWRRFIEAAP